MNVFKHIKHRMTIAVFLLGLLLLYITHTSIWLWLIWIFLFLIIEFCGAYFIRLNFHLNSINQLDISEKKVMLTFDDGIHSTNTPRVLEVLQKYNVKAIFFIIGKNIQGNELIINRITSEGHLIGNHSYSHHNFIDLWSANKVYEDFKCCQNLICKYQPSSNLFRPPYGVTNPNIAKAVKKLNLQSIGWSIRSYDTSSNNIEKIQTRILNQLKPGAIILLHDRLELMPDLLDKLIPEIKQRGYDFSIDVFSKP